ncbi:sigma-70 family RNA polymerase sigma factor [Pelagibius sp.]|uniref:sigma-70 family RNA polymerase sigma factor n=1 Tax=Pelagibius sp. TaxID=1931238 RepID=UPI003BAE6814
MLRNRSLLIAEIPHLRRYARSLARDPDVADDLVQGCLERALSRFHLWQPERRLRPWLFTMLHNLHVDSLRHRASAAAGALREQTASRPSQHASQEHHLTARRVLAQIDRLPPEQRDAVLLVGVNELSYGEAAAILGIPPGTLMSRLHRGRAKLREHLEMTEGTPAIRRVK